MTSNEPDAETGISSDRVGPTGPGQHDTTGVRDTSPPDESSVSSDKSSDAQTEGGDEPRSSKPGPPVAGYSSRDPRSKDHPYEP